MKTKWKLFLFCVLMVAAMPVCSQVGSWKEVRIPALPEFKPQEPKRIELPNGMVIFLQEDHELPLIDGVARIRGGSRSEPRSPSTRLARRRPAPRRPLSPAPARSLGARDSRDGRRTRSPALGLR